MTPKERMYKLAAGVIYMGDPRQAGKGIADIVLFLLKRIDIKNRNKAIDKMKLKILALNPLELSSKKSPASASMGQAITFIKTILNGHNPIYIKSILNEIVKNLH